MNENAEDQKRGIIKIVSGGILLVVGIAGMILGKKTKTKTLRLSIIALSVISLGSGAYLFIDGVSDIAIGTIGHYKLGESYQQSLTYASPDDFDNGITLAHKAQADLRRLHVRCPDGSKSFTVFITKFGNIGIPKSSVICADGFEVLKYNLRD